MSHVKSLLGFGALAALCASPLASAALPTGLGWSALPNTKIRSVCAAENGFNVGGNTGCAAITLAWNSAVYDTKRNRLIVFGGGHNDYYGNEVYAIDVVAPSVARLTDPAPAASNTTCVESLANGTQPNARHTYDGIEYVPTVDKMFVFGGSLACGAGNFGNDTWLFNLATNTWEAVNATGTIPSAVAGIQTAFDPVSGLVYVHDDAYLYSFNPSTRVYTRLNTTPYAVGYHMNMTVDPKRRKVVLLGFDAVANAGRVWTYDIGSGSTYTRTQFTTTNGATIVGTNYPGVDYDSATDRIVAWSDKTPNVVYSLNMDTGAWATVTYTGGPAPVGNGTNGRWRYVPAHNVYVLLNSVDADAVIFRANTGGGSTADTTAPSVPGSVAGSATTATTASLTWSASTDNTGVTGYRVSRCSGASCTPSTVIATPTANSFSDSGLTASTTYRYSVVAFDAAGNSSTASATVSVTTPAAAGGGGGSGGGASADTDFAARCSAPGVVKCIGFDNTTTDIVRNVNFYPDGQGNFRGGLDTTTKTSGAGALRFDLPPPPHAGGNIGGSWTSADSAGAFGRTFGQNSTFYVQFRQRLTSEMVTTSWGDRTWKNVIFHMGGRSCANIELTTSNFYGTPLAQMNTDCGARGFWTTMDGSQLTDTPPLLMQQGDYMQCAYGSTNATNCFYWPANEWVTVYYKIHIGTWDQPNSSVEAFVARDGATAYKQFIKVMNVALKCNQTSCSTAPGSQEGYNNLTFTPYMTGLSGSVGPSTTASMWFDELIVSTQPIAVPSSSPRPNPPSAFSVR